MGIATILFIALGLSLDCFAVSITSGIAIKNLKINHALKIALFFGLFQAVMPVIGWLAGLGLKGFVSRFDHWVAFCLLSIVGLKIIYEARGIDSEKVTNPLNIYVLLMLSVATSIDALAIGLTFAFLKISIASPVIIIGTITFLLSFLGIFIGNKIGHFFEEKIEIIAGFILIGIGIKILLEHLF